MVMILPSKETLTFHREINIWIESENREDGLVYTFKKDTPKEILDKFDSIKDKLTFKIKGYKVAD